MRIVGGSSNVCVCVCVCVCKLPCLCDQTCVHMLPLLTCATAAGTSPMSPFFKDTIAALLHCAQRHNHHEHSKVQISAFEAINDLVRAATRDTLDIVAQLIQVGKRKHAVGGVMLKVP